MDYKSIILESLNSVFWIDPTGKIIESNASHTDMIIDNPELFDTTLEEIKEIYKKHNEPFAEYAGNANSEILQNYVNKGWIRIRLTRKINLCNITVGRHYINDPITLSHIHYFAKEYLSSSTEISINAYGGNNPLKYTGNQIKNKKFVEEKFKIVVGKNNQLLKG
jgi:hypothetical protein